jgi:signal transduction histidine kinase
MFGSVAPTLDHEIVHAIAELARGLGTDCEASLRRIVRFDAEVLHVERVSFWSFAPETSSIHCDVGYVASVGSFEHGATLFASDLPEYFEALREARPLNMADVQTDPRCSGLRDYCASRGIASMFDVPVWLEGKLSGVLCHEHVGATRRWDVEEEDFATSMSQVISSALAARAHTRTDGGTRRAAFLDTVSSLLFSLDAREIADGAVAMCAPGLAEVAVLWVKNSDDVLELRALKHRDPPQQDVIMKHLESGRWTPFMAARVTRERQSLLLPDATPSLLVKYGLSIENRALMARLDIATVMSVPLSARGKTFGAMSFGASGRHYGADDLALAENIGTRVAAALENARLYDLAREAIRARDELLVIVAHELRTPLTALQLRTDYQLRLAERCADTRETARREAIAREVRRFSALVEHMLDALNIRATGVVLTREPSDLATTVRQRVGLFAPRANAVGSTIALDSASSVAGRWDTAGLGKVIDVLLDNAIKFGRGGPIAVSLRADETYCELSVRDQGIGIPPDRLSAIFQPFQRAVPKEHFGGLGLGLSIAKAIVEAHGGTIAATSRPGEGATFVVRLPLANEGRVPSEAPIG